MCCQTAVRLCMLTSALSLAPVCVAGTSAIHARAPCALPCSGLHGVCVPWRHCAQHLLAPRRRGEERGWQHQLRSAGCGCDLSPHLHARWHHPRACARLACRGARQATGPCGPWAGCWWAWACCRRPLALPRNSSEGPRQWASAAAGGGVHVPPASSSSERAGGRTRRGSAPAAQDFALINLFCLRCLRACRNGSARYCNCAVPPATCCRRSLLSPPDACSLHVDDLTASWSLVQLVQGQGSSGEPNDRVFPRTLTCAAPALCVRAP